MKPVIVLIGCGLILGGCESTSLWTQPDPAAQKFNADWEECQKENQAGAQNQTGRRTLRVSDEAEGFGADLASVVMGARAKN